MARIAGVNIPTNKRVEIALTYIHGIGLTSAKKLTAQLGKDIDTWSWVKKYSSGCVMISLGSGRYFGHTQTSGQVRML